MSEICIEPSIIRHVLKTQRMYQLAYAYALRQAVTSFEITSRQEEFQIEGECKQENEIYHCKVQLDQKQRVIAYTCDCGRSNELQACAHIGALLIRINQVQPNALPYHYQKQENEETIEQESYEERLRQLKEARNAMAKEERRMQAENVKRQYFEERFAYSRQWIHQEHMALRQRLSIDNCAKYRLFIQVISTSSTSYEYGVYLRFLVGRHKPYVIRNIFTFLHQVRTSAEVSYGRELTFVHHSDAFDEDSRKILSFLFQFEQELQEQSVSINNRFLFVHGETLRSLYELCIQLPPSLCNLEVIEKTARFDIQIHEHEGYVQLECLNYPKLILGYHDESGMYQIDKQTLCFLRFDDNGKLYRLLKLFHQYDKELLLEEKDIKGFVKYIWQDIQDFVHVQGDASLFDLTPMNQLHLYGDMDENGQLALRLEGINEGTILNGFRNTKGIPLEMEIVETYIRSFSSMIDEGNGIAYLSQEDDSTYSFLKDGLSFLSDYCEIFISDAIKKLGNVHHVHLQAGIKFDNQILQLHFESSDISKEELAEILSSYQKKKKYHRLKNNHLISLDAKELEELSQIVEMLRISKQQLKEENLQLPAYRAFSLFPMIHSSALRFTIDEAYAALMHAFSQKQGQKFTIPNGYEHILRDYQIKGYEWLKLMNHYQFNAILADDMGLGKTLQVIALLESEKTFGTSMIVVPASLVLNWRDEIMKFAQDLKALCVIGNIQKRRELIKTIHSYDIVITSYDYLKKDIASYEMMRFHYVILDEAQYIKNQKTQNTKAVKRLMGHHKLALTGTPIENSLAELWSIFDFLMPGYLYSYSYFMQEYERPIIKEKDSVKQEKLKQLVEPFILRRTKQTVLKELPDKVEQTLTIAFDEKEEALYQATMLQFSSQLRSKSQQTVGQFQILSMLTKLRQICCEPRLLYENIETPSSKLQSCIQLCLSLREHHQKVLLFSSFTSMLDLIETELKKYHFRFLKLTGSDTKENRYRKVKEFQNGDIDVFLISLKAGGTGLNLTAAQAVIHFDPWWNVSAQNQATDRAYRIGQEKNVQVFQFIMQNSIEEKIQRLQAKKQNLADTFVENSDGGIAQMDIRDILSLFS